MTEFNKLPYRPSVGLMIINSEMNVFIARRKGVKSKNYWQMPQGGIDLGETPSEAAMREMKEEIGSNNGLIISESKKWHKYDVPSGLSKNLWNGMYKGQVQKWFLIKFAGNDDEIDLFSHHIQEFTKWKWVKVDEMLDFVVPFKKKLYHSIITEFKEHL